MVSSIPKPFINELLQRTNIVGVINDRVSLKKAGKDFVGLCPFHEEKTPSFSVSPDKDMYYCFGCGAGGDAIKFLREYEGLSFTEAVESLAASAGLEVPRQQSSRPERDLRPLHNAMLTAERYYKAQLKASPKAVGYLKSRSLTGVAARDFGLGFAGDAWDGLQRALTQGADPIANEVLREVGLISRNDRGQEYDRFRNRIMFPVRDVRGHIVAFGGRLIGDGQGPKYLNSPETPIFRKRLELYGLFEARRSSRALDSLIVVEGYLDVIALAQSGIRNAVATLGTATGEGHYQKLYQYVDEVVCCFDGDQAGKRAAWKALEGALGSLSGGRSLKFMLLPENEDPDSLVRRLGADDFCARVRQATPAIEYLFRELARGLDLTAVDDRARLVSLATPYIERVPAQSHLQSMMRSRLKELTGGAADSAASAAVGLESRPLRTSAGGGRQGRRDRLQPRLPQRLLSILLQSPGVLAEADPKAVEVLAEEFQNQSLCAEVVRYAAQHPDLDRAQLLGRWMGQDGFDELDQLRKSRPLLGAEDMALEFKDGIERLLAKAGHRRRQRLIEDMKVSKDSSTENKKLDEFMVLRRGAEV